MAISTATKAATDALAVNRAPVSVGAQEVHKWMQSLASFIYRFTLYAILGFITS